MIEINLVLIKLACTWILPLSCKDDSMIIPVEIIRNCQLNCNGLRMNVDVDGSLN